jgi:hypothetical protein
MRNDDKETVTALYLRRPLKGAGMPISGFDDHATVVALEFLIVRLISTQCRAAPDPMAAQHEWSAAIDAEKAQIEDFAFGANTPSDASVNAIVSLGEFDRLVGEISGAVRR